MTEQRLRVGSWPGYITTQNRFLELFLNGLASAGAEIVSMADVQELSRRAGDVDVVILHWPQRVFWEASSRVGVLAKIIRLIVALRKSRPEVKVVWLAHDLVPHDAAGLQRVLWSPYLAALLSVIDGYATFSERTLRVVAEAQPRLRRKPGLALPHPAYPDEPQLDRVREEMRAGYGFEADELVVGYCGQVRFNKGVDVLAEVFQRWDRPKSRLLIAGLPAGKGLDLVPRLKQTAAADPRVRLDLGDLSDDRFTGALVACDLVVAPFRNYLHSGSLVHALSLDVPVVTSATPFSLDLRDAAGPSWVRIFEGELSVTSLDANTLLPLPAGRALPDDFAARMVGEQFVNWLEGTVSR